MRALHLHVSAVLAGCLALPALGQTPSYVGNWAGTVQGQTALLPLEVTLTEKDGTWRVSPAAGAAGRNNPCLGKAMPVVVERAEAEKLVLTVDGAKVIAGCNTQQVSLTLSNGELTGTLADGRAVMLKRK